MPQVAKNIEHTDQHKPSTGKAKADGELFGRLLILAFLILPQKILNEQSNSPQIQIIDPLAIREELYSSTENEFQTLLVSFSFLNRLGV